MGVEGPAAPGPACLGLRRLSRPGWVGGAPRFLGQPRSRCGSLSPPPLATPPPAPRSLLSPKFVFSLFSRLPGPSVSSSPASPGECGSAGRPAIHWLCARPLLPSPPRPAPVAGSSCRNQLCAESGNGRLPRQQRDTRFHCPGIWETSRSPPCSSLAFGPDHTGLDLITSPAVLKGPEGKSWLVPLSFPVLPESEPPAPA